MLKIVNKSIGLIKSDGFKGFFISLTQYIYHRVLRPILPGMSYTNYVDGIEYGFIRLAIPRKSFDFLFPRYDLNLKKELGLRLAHTFLTKKNDRVLIIGGGNGLSTVTAARIVGDRGSVTVFDGLTGEDNETFGVSRILSTAKLNKVDNIVTANWAFVTDKPVLEDYDLYKNEKTNPPLIHPTSLPECDVLEMDANGAELEILEHMTIRPRVIIFELEAPFYKSHYKNNTRNPFEVLDLLKDMNYAVIKQTGHEGIDLSSEDLNELTKIQYDSEKKHVLNSGAKDSPVLYCVRKDYLNKYLDNNKICQS